MPVSFPEQWRAEVNPFIVYVRWLLFFAHGVCLGKS